MKKAIKYFAFALMIVVAGSMTAMSQTGSKNSLGAAPNDFQAQWAHDDGFLMDIRTPDEYMAANLAHSKLCSFNDQSFASILDMLDKNKAVYVYDQNGANIAKVLDMMSKKGFKKVVALQGGIDAWMKAGLPVVNMKK